MFTIQFNERQLKIIDIVNNLPELLSTGAADGETIKNAEKELTIRSIAHNIQKIHEKLNATLI